ncbi:MAG: AAA family ATPase, partial [Bdellovibrionaceae bacterium]|nr:AAA family ATPase [Pseudobdellovibrionaceae bacterium]
WLNCPEGQGLKPEIVKLTEVEKAIDQRRLQFFLIDPERRNNLISIQTESSKQAQALLDVGASQKAAKATREEAEQNQVKAQTQSREAESYKEKEVAAAYGIVEKYRQELAENNLQFAKEIEERLNKYKSYTQDLIALATTDKTQLEETYKAYVDSTNLWRKLTEATFRIMINSLPYNVPSPPSKINEDMRTPESEKLYLSYLDSVDKAAAEYEKALKSNVELSRQEKEIVANALLKAGAIRAQFFQATRRLDSSKIVIFSDDAIGDLINEVRIVPFRFVAYVVTKAAELKHMSSSGLVGWVNISKQILVFFILIFVPIFLFFILGKISMSLDVWRRQLISRSSLDYRFRTSLALWLNRLNPYMPWVVMILASEFAKRLLGIVGQSELGIFIPYLELYFAYRIFRRALVHILSGVLVGGSLEKLKVKNEELQGTARRIGRLFFIEIALLHATEDAVRRAIVYTLISSSIWYLNILFLIYEFNKWREEILLLSEKNLPQKFNLIVEKVKSSKLLLVFLPIILFLSLVYIGGYKLFLWLIRYDFFKQITSEIYKKRLQEHVDSVPVGTQKKQEIPNEYFKYFDISLSPDKLLYITRSRESFLEVLGGVNDWVDGKSEIDAIVIYGDKGIGKTALLKKVCSEVQNAKSVYLDLKGKIASKEELYQILSELVGVSFSSCQEFLEVDKSLPKTVIFLDNSQNIFLAKQHGLEAYRGLIDIMNLQTVNTFWCLAYNRRSWDYLKGVFGQEHFYGVEIDVRSWSDVEIQRLIQVRHRASGFRLNFDKVIEAVNQSDSADGVNQVEAQFFRLLWGQSRGNPRAAILLWLSALSYKGNNKVVVGIPEFSRIDQLTDMSDETLFVLSAIIRHENLCLDEIIAVTNIQAAKIKKAIKYCEDKKLIKMSSDNRFRVTPQSQYFVNSFLLGKNFLYE